MRIASRASGIASSVAIAALSLPVRAATLLDETGLSSTANSAGLGGSGADPNRISSIIGAIIGSLMGFAGILLVVLFIYAGFLWMTAQGDDAQVKRAKMIIKNAIIGTVLMFSAYAIANTVATFVSDATK